MASPVPFSDYCFSTCVEPIIDIICTVEGFEQEESCVCSNCTATDLAAMNRTSRAYCANQYPVSRAPTCSESSTGQSSGTPSPTSGGTGSDSDGSSEGSGGGSSSSSSSGRRGGSGTAIKAGVSVGVVVAILLFLGIIYLVLGRRKFNKLQKEKAAQEAAAAAAAGGGNAGAAQVIGAQPSEKQNYQEQGSINISSPVSGQITPNTAYQSQTNASYYPQVPQQPQEPQQPQLYQQPQSFQGEAGPRWGQTPNTYDDGPRR